MTIVLETTSNLSCIMSHLYIISKANHQMATDCSQVYIKCHLKAIAVFVCVLEQEQECSEHVEHALIVYTMC